jgi:predicted PurR-regulated permease PerM
MEIGERDIKNTLFLAVVAALFFVSFLIVRPIILTVIGGLLLAYIFFSIYRFTFKKSKNPNFAAAMISVLVVFFFALPIFFLP